MKTHVLLALVGLATGFVVPAFTQEKEEANPFPFGAIQAKPEIVQQLEAINEKWDEACNKHDAAAVAALYTAKAILTDVFQRYNPSDQSTKISYVYAFGDDLCAIGGWTVTVHSSQRGGGYLVNVYTRVRDTWKIRAAVGKFATGP